MSRLNKQIEERETKMSNEDVLLLNAAVSDVLGCDEELSTAETSATTAVDESSSKEAAQQVEEKSSETTTPVAIETQQSETIESETIAPTTELVAAANHNQSTSTSSAVPSAFLEQSLLMDTRFLFKNTRYFLMKSNNYENVRLAKRMVS